MELGSGERGHQLRDHRTRDREDAYAKSQHEEREQADALARVVEPGRRGDFEKRGKIPRRGVGSERQQRDDAVKRSNSLVEESQGQEPPDHGQRGHGVDPEE